MPVSALGTSSSVTQSASVPSAPEAGHVSVSRRAGITRAAMPGRRRDRRAACAASLRAAVLPPLLLGALVAVPAMAQHEATLDPVVVIGEAAARNPAAGAAEEAAAASEVFVPGAALRGLPVARPGEVLEAAPGLVVTQHSG